MHFDKDCVEMTKQTSLAIALTATTFLCTPAVASSLTPTLGENSVFSYSEGSKSNYNFTLQEPNADGILTTKYYKIDLKPEVFATSPRISWTAVAEDQKDAADVVAVQLPNKETKYFKYTYTPENGRTVYNTPQGSLSGDINADYVGSTSTGNGNLFNSGTINNVTGDFINNNAAFGGAVYNNTGTIDHITGDFIGNTSHGYAGAIYNSTGKINNITGNFIGNSASRNGGGALYNWRGTIDSIRGSFIGNYAVDSGGALFNNQGGKIRSLTGDFIANAASFRGGAIINNGIIENITGDFIGNNIPVSTENFSGHGGAIINNFTINNITGNFIGNYVESTRETKGGAIYNTGTITLSSDEGTHFFSGNYTLDNKRGKIYNAITKADLSSLTFVTKGNGAWVINDNIYNDGEPEYYDDQELLNFVGDDTIDTATGTTTQYIAMNNDIVNAGTVTVKGTTLRFGAFQHEDQTAKNWDGKGAFVAALNEDGIANRDAAAVTSLSLNNAVFDIANGYLETVKLKGYSATDSFLHIDVDPDNMSADMLNVNGNVEGVTKMIVHASSNADIRGKGEILFAQSENDTTGNEGSFVVSRVYKSPYLFDVNYTQRAENSNQWGLVMNDQDNPDKEVTPELPDIPSVKPQPLPGSDRPVAPEVIGAESLPAAALAQNSNMVYNIMNKVSANRLYCPGCGFYDYYWNGEAFHNLWANAVYNTLRIKTPTDIDAEVWGLEAGGDLQHDLNNKLGLFLSYRKGNYDMNGDGKHHYSTIGSEIDIDSYLAGLYYRYDRNHWWTFATVYGGIQRVDLKTKDGIKSDTDGTEFGGSVELGYDYNLSKTLYLTPSIGAFYTQVDYDDATDSAGKVAKYNTLRQLELEAGVKLTKAFVTDDGYANLYVKPSVVQTVTDGDEVRITGLGKVNTLDDQTLGRIEIGGRYGFTEQLSAYGWANHTFGDDYKASTFGLGLSYSW